MSKPIHNGHHVYSECTTLRKLADDTYVKMLPAERMALDLRCDHLVKQLNTIKPRPLGLQAQSLRELILAVELCQMYPGETMTQIMHNALEGRRRVE